VHESDWTLRRPRYYFAYTFPTLLTHFILTSLEGLPLNIGLLICYFVTFHIS